MSHVGFDNGRQKTSVVIIGCGKAGLEHARVLRRYFSSKVIVTALIDLNEHNTELLAKILGPLYNPKIGKQDFGIVCDSRPYSVRQGSDLRSLVDHLFSNFVVLTEKPLATYHSTPEYSRVAERVFVNTQRILTPGWKNFRRKAGDAQRLVIVERNPAFSNVSPSLLFDFLPHAAAFAFDVINDDLKDLVKVGDNSVELCFHSGRLATIFFEYAVRPSATVIINSHSGSSAYNWPNGHTYSDRVSQLAFFDILRDRILKRPDSTRLKMLIQYFSGYSLYDDFRYSWERMLNAGDHAAGLHELNQEKLGKFFIDFCGHTDNRNLVAAVKKSPRIFDVILVGGTGKVGQSILSELPNISVMVVSRKPLPSHCGGVKCEWMAFADFLDANCVIECKRVVLMSSAMNADVPAHNAHNSLLREVVEKLKNSGVSHFLHVSSRAVFQRPGSVVSERHTNQSAMRRGPYAYGKLLDLQLVSSLLTDDVLDVVYPGVVRSNIDGNYGVKVTLGNMLLVVGSAKQCVPYSDSNDLTQWIVSWITGNAESQFTNRYITFQEFFQSSFPRKSVIFIPRFLTFIFASALEGKYAQVKPMERLWSRLEHFYE